MEKRDQTGMRVCVRCNGCITEANDSREHVVPNAIGGKLKTKGFICTNCNSASGERWDAELSRQMNPLCLFFSIIRDRGVSPSQTFETSAGEKIRISHDGSLALDRPTYREVPIGDGIRVEITARTMREARKMLQGVKRKFPRTDISGILDNVSINTFYAKGAVKFEILFGGEMAGRSLVKTALAFAHCSGISVENCGAARNYLRGNRQVVPFGYFYESDLIEARPKGLPLHCVAISGNPATGMLLGYVEYFGVLRVVICLSDKYVGDPVDRAYAIDPMNSNELNLSVRLTFSPSDMEAIYQYQKMPAGTIQRAFAEVAPIGLARKFETEKNRVIREAVHYAFAHCGAREGEMLTPEQVQKLSGLVVEKMMPFILHNVRRAHRQSS
ncbi:MAG: HNH endonuclease [Xanthobacteraceae bacterium]